MQIAFQAENALSSVSWIDWTALAVLLAFAVAGLFRGLVWQLTRAGILVLAYLTAIVAGPKAADLARGVFTAEHQRAHEYVGFVVVFVGVIVLAGLVLWLLQRMSEPPELTPASRAMGGVIGVVTGGLIVLALLTGVRMLYDWTGGAAGVVHAAERSKAEAVGRDVLRVTQRALPSPWAERADDWRELLGDPELEARGTFRQAEPAGAAATPAGGR